METLADAGYEGLGAQTGGRVVTPPRRKFKKNVPDWYEEMHERQRKAHSSHHIRVEHGTAHLKNWRALARHLGRREHIATPSAIAHSSSEHLMRSVISAVWPTSVEPLAGTPSTWRQHPPVIGDQPDP